MATATNTRTARPRPAAANLKPRLPGATSTKAGAMNVEFNAAKPNHSANSTLKPTGAPKPKPGATMQIGPAQLGKSAPRLDTRDTGCRVLTSPSDAVHRKVIQSIEGAERAMSMARADVQTTKSSKKGRNKVVSKANEVVGALLTPGRHVVVFLSGLGVLFSPFKQVSSALAVSITFLLLLLGLPIHNFTNPLLGQALIKSELDRPDDAPRAQQHAQKCAP